MMTAFYKGDIVIALTSTQGLVQDARYEIVHVYNNTTPFGDFVSYEVVPEGTSDTAKLIENGHLVLKRIDTSRH